MGYPPELRAKVDKIVAASGIESRHTCVGDGNPANFMSELERDPRSRALVWEQGAPRMAVAAARDALARWQHGSASDVTHVVTHSCTGFSAPGLDFFLIRELGLAPTTRKLGVNFMGCFGAFSALYVAKQIVEADCTGRAVVLVACAETCTAHMTRDQRLELIVGNTIFADGAAAAIVTHAGFTGAGAAQRLSPAEPALPQTCEWALGAMENEVLPGTEGSMSWRQGSFPGQYDMWLDRSIPSALSGFFVKRGLALVAKVGIASAWGCAWAIHPGGRAIIKAFQDAFALLRIGGEGLEHSAEVLRRHGNMSSPTILYVLQRVLASTRKDEVFMAGFGPGLSVEFGRLYRVPRGQRMPLGAAAPNPVDSAHTEGSPAAEVTAPSEAAASASYGAASGDSGGVELHRLSASVVPGAESSAHLPVPPATVASPVPSRRVAAS